MRMARWTGRGRCVHTRRSPNTRAPAASTTPRTSPARHAEASLLKIAIVGGGIGGMTLALSLFDAGLGDVDIYESAGTIKELGVGINILPHAVRELSELGLLDPLAAVGIPTGE